MNAHTLLASSSLAAPLAAPLADPLAHALAHSPHPWTHPLAQLASWPDELSPVAPAAPVPLSSQISVSSEEASAGEPLRHILLGSPGGVRQTIHLLHTLRYVENALWSPLVSIPNEQIIITPRQGEVMSILVRQLR